jgi:hypothetical protein
VHPSDKPCREGFDHDWQYDPGDPEVGCFSCWHCIICEEIDVYSEPPSDDDDYWR